MPTEQDRSDRLPDGGNGDRAARVEAVVDSVLARRMKGEPVDFAAVAGEHRDLWPELGQRLEILQRMEAAATEADGSSHSSFGVLADDDALREEFDFLERSLTQYQLVERLQEGGQGVLYRAVQRSTNRLVALKVLRDGPLATHSQRLRFEREVEVISRLRHPNVVTLYESGVVAGRYYYAMQFIEGAPLDEYFLLHQPDLGERLELFCTILGAVSYAHQNGVIHRDLKPSNILIDIEGQPHVLDFGLAKDLSLHFGENPTKQVSQTREIVGTLAYLSPEQIREGMSGADVRSDIYAIGVMMFHAVSGNYPYNVTGSVSEVWSEILHRPPIGLRRAASQAMAVDRVDPGEISDELEAILGKALEKEPDERYQYAAALQDDLRNLLDGEAVSAMAGRRWYLFKKTVRRYRTQVAIAAAFMLILLVSTITVSVFWSQASRQRDTARSVARVAHATLESIVVEIEELLQSIAGGGEVRDELLQRVDSELYRLKTLVEGDQEFDDLQATVYEKLGDIASARYKEAESEAHYRDFLRLSRQWAESGEADPVKAGRLVARAHVKLGVVLGEGHDHFEQAIQIGTTLCGAEPSDNGVCFDLAWTFGQFGRYLAEEASYEEAAGRYAQALRIIERVRLTGTGGEFGWDNLQAQIYEWSGHTQSKLGNDPKAVQFYDKSVALRQYLYDKRPHDARLRSELAASLAYRSDSLVAEKRAQEALGDLHQAVALVQGLVSAEPMAMRWRRELFGYRHRLVMVLRNTGNLLEARRQCDAAMVDATALTDDKESESLLALGYAHRLQGMMLVAEGDPAGAVEHYNESIRFFSELVQVDEEKAEHKSHLAGAYDQLGNVYATLKRSDESFAAYKMAHALRLQVYIRYPDVPDNRAMLAYALAKLGDWHRLNSTDGQRPEALRLYQQAEQHLVAVLQGSHFTGYQTKYQGWLDEIRRDKAIVKPD